jgi:hypothetical protein
VLTIGKLGVGPAQLEYYERQVAAGAEDYYAGRGESPGVWLGTRTHCLSTSPRPVRWLAAITRHNPGPELREVIRQHNPDERRALEALHDGDAQSYLDHKGSDITIYAAEADAISAVIADWAAQSAQTGRRSVMIARDNGTREQLNRAARAHLEADGRLPTAGITIGEREWVCGDRVIARRNDRRLDIDNGTFATITAVLPDGQGVRILTDRGQERTLDDRYLRDHLETRSPATPARARPSTPRPSSAGRRSSPANGPTPPSPGHATQQRFTSSQTAATTPHERGDYAPPEPAREPGEALTALARAMTRTEAEPLAVERSASVDIARARHASRQPEPRARTDGWAQRDLGRARPAAGSAPAQGAER